MSTATLVRSRSMTSEAVNAALEVAVDRWSVANHRAIAELRRRRAAELEAEIQGLKDSAADSFARVIELGGSHADLMWALRDAGLSADNRTVRNLIEQGMVGTE